MDSVTDLPSVNSTEKVVRLAEVFIKPENIILLIVELILMTLASFGNGIVLASWLTHRPIRTPSNLLLISLAVCDFLGGAIVIPFTSLQLLFNQWLLGFLGCQLSAIIGSTLLFVGSNHLVLIAVDRYMIVQYGTVYLNQRSLRSCAKSIAFVWLVGFLTSCPYLLDPKGSIQYKETSPDKYTCNYRHLESNILCQDIFSLLVPSILMVYFYIKIFFGISKNLKTDLVNQKFGETCNDLVTINVSQDESNYNDNFKTTAADSIEIQQDDSTESAMKSEVSRSEKKKLASTIKKSRRAARTLGILILCFSVCFYPFMCVSMLQIVFGFRLTFVSAVFSFLSQVNSAVNPFVYGVHSKDFRAAFKRMGLPLR